MGSKQLSNHFTKERIDECAESLFRKIDYRRIMSLPWKQKGPFLFYRFIRFYINAYVKIKLRFIKTMNGSDLNKVKQNIIENSRIIKDNLLAIVLTGSASQNAYKTGWSDLDFLIVVERLDFDVKRNSWNCNGA